MPILLKTQIERTAKAPIPACHARVGGLCGFQDTVERVPTGSLKTGRCADVRERWRKMLVLARTAVGKAACGKCRKTLKTVKIEGFWTLRRESGEKAARKRRESGTKPRGRARPAAVTSARRAGSFGALRGRSKSSEKQPEGVAE